MTDERIIAYLLEELPEDEAERFEDECFADENCPAQIGLVEEDLIDDYLCHELTPERRRRFELNYLTTAARMERVRMAAALLRHVNDPAVVSPATAPPLVAAPPGEQAWRGQVVAGRSWEHPLTGQPAATTPTGQVSPVRLRSFWSRHSWAFNPTFALVAVVVIISGALWLLSPHTSSPRTFTVLTLSASVNNNRAQGAQAKIVKLPLRDDAQKPADALKISLMLPERLAASPRYRVELENDNGEMRPLEVVEQNAQSVSVLVPAAQLTRGQYALHLIAVNTDSTEHRIPGSYFFTLE